MVNSNWSDFNLLIVSLLALSCIVGALIRISFDIFPISSPYGYSLGIRAEKCDKRYGSLDIVFGTIGGVSFSLLTASFAYSAFGILGFIIAAIVFYVMGYDGACSSYNTLSCRPFRLMLLKVTSGIVLALSMGFTVLFDTHCTGVPLVFCSIFGGIVGGILGRRSETWISYDLDTFNKVFLVLVIISLPFAAICLKFYFL